MRIHGLYLCTHVLIYVHTCLVSLFFHLYTAETLRKISSGFAIGFGSFVDKQILPFGLSSHET